MMKPLKILMIVPDLAVANGVATFAMNYLSHFDERVSVDFVLLSDKPSPYYEMISERGGQVFVLPSVYHLSSHIKYCKDLLMNGDHQIIHDNSLLKTLPLMWVAKKLGIPARILHSHSSKLGSTPLKERIARLLIPLLRKQANAYYACSELAGKMMFGNQHFTVIPNAIDFRRFTFDSKKRSTLRKMMDVNDKRVVGSVGRLAEEKNPMFAVDVFCKLKSRMPYVEYWWIGDGHLHDSVKEYAEKCGVEGGFKLLGNKSDVDMYYHAMDCFVMPSIFEGWGMTAIEAQVSGLPAVLSDVIPKEVQISDDVAFLSLKEDSVDVWANAVIRELERDIDRENKRIDVQSEYDIANAARVLEEEYFCIWRKTNENVGV